MTAIAWALIWIATAYYHYQDKPDLKGSSAVGAVICCVMMLALTIKELVR